MVEPTNDNLIPFAKPEAPKEPSFLETQMSQFEKMMSLKPTAVAMICVSTSGHPEIPEGVTAVEIFVNCPDQKMSETLGMIEYAKFIYMQRS